MSNSESWEIQNREKCKIGHQAPAGCQSQGPSLAQDSAPSTPDDSLNWDLDRRSSRGVPRCSLLMTFYSLKLWTIKFLRFWVWLKSIDSCLDSRLRSMEYTRIFGVLSCDSFPIGGSIRNLLLPVHNVPRETCLQKQFPWLVKIRSKILPNIKEFYQFFMDSIGIELMASMRTL